MTAINPKNLLNSKWTAVNPKNKELHWLITKLEIENNGQVNHCQIMAIHSKRCILIDWQELKDSSIWLRGWL